MSHPKVGHHLLYNMRTFVLKDGEAILRKKYFTFVLDGTIAGTYIRVGVIKPVRISVGKPYNGIKLIVIHYFALVVAFEKVPQNLGIEME